MLKRTRWSNGLVTIVMALASCAFSYPLRAVDGGLDPSFGIGGKVTTPGTQVLLLGISGMALQPDGRIVVGGPTFDGANANMDFAVARYLADGSLDSAFGTGGVVVTEFFGLSDIPDALALQHDGKIVLAGSADRGFNYDFALVRYNADGTLDSSFGNGGRVTTDIFGPTGGGDIVYGIALQTDGKLVVAGSALARYDFDGNLDSSFGSGGKVLFPPGMGARAVVVQRDGKILVAGGVSHDNSPTGDDWLLIRYSPDGTPDSSFGTKGVVTTDFHGSGDVASSLTLQNDGKIVVAGYASYPQNVGPSFAVARYEVDGSLDASFDEDGRRTVDLEGFSEDVFSVLVQSDGRVVLGGLAANPDFSYDFALVRLNADGTDDPTFGAAGIVRTDFSGGSDGIRSLAIQPDGKIVAAGSASNGFALARYLSTPIPSLPPACARSAGFWRKHRREWPVNALTLGSQSYSAAEIAELLKTPIRGDASLLLARELIASKFNLAGGAGSPELFALVSSADALLSGFSGRLPYRVRPGSSAGRSMVALSGNLASWNNRRSSPDCKDSSSN